MMNGGLSLLSVRQQVSAAIRAAIHDGELPPGARLTERQICERAGVSRTIAREVVRELEAERLIESNRRNGFVVASMSLKEIGDLYDMRVLLEARACQLCAEAMTPEIARRLDLAMAAIESAAAGDDREAQRTSNTLFYETIFEAADNVVLGQILHSLHGRISFLRSRSMSRPGRPQESLRELKAILAALKAGDGAAAARLSTTHIEAARSVALAALGDHGRNGQASARKDVEA
ncbi:GntR family transcriptional regulator [Mesorhizobium sp. BR1-1-16]|uniref:GntR family transcriptional regulator n=1 Tax=Mesorhizobium sp. BR1-1-16 TaxID=2876653 RepID=UPI001CCEFD60|nr:GntR family transcriptional regulator [Mesorhizobium sp. BR1-1-16]MBZ9938752.1 GntR family transcriptional regulator [Mesorhizobium sp. BR1-1-16]